MLGMRFFFFFLIGTGPSPSPSPSAPPSTRFFFFFLTDSCGGGGTAAGGGRTDHSPDAGLAAARSAPEVGPTSPPPGPSFRPPARRTRPSSSRSARFCLAATSVSGASVGAGARARVEDAALPRGLLDTHGGGAGRWRMSWSREMSAPRSLATGPWRAGGTGKDWRVEGAVAGVGRGGLRGMNRRSWRGRGLIDAVRTGRSCNEPGLVSTCSTAKAAGS